MARIRSEVATMKQWIVGSVLGLLALPAQAALNVFACEPEWAALATELGGERVSVYAATTAQQDPHRIEARPSLIARMRQADVLVCTGAELEAGWLPVLLRQAANGRVQSGQPGHFMAAEQVERLEVPAVADRALGDLHMAGNPHVHTDPRRLLQIAGALGERPAAWLAERTGMKVVVLPYTVGGSPQATDLFALFDETVARLLEAAP
jgi:zinc/manganese transport system substrate-binding protein